MPEIKTNRLALRGIRQDDLEFIYRALSHPEVIRYYGVHFQTLEATKEQMQWYADLEASGTGIWWLITFQDQPMGACGFNDQSDVHRKAEIGFWLLPEFQGRGFMREAVQAVVEHGFTTRGLHRIVAFVESENAPSKKLLKQLNFVHEGTMVDCEQKNGRFISLDIFARLGS